MEYYVGLDVSLRSCALCIVDGKGVVLFERELPCDVIEIADCLSGFPHPIERVGFEAGSMSPHLCLGLTAEGFDIVWMEARQVSAALSAMRNKTDKTDARGIAQILRTSWFGPVHMKSREAHGLRALLSTRKVLLKKTMDLANEVRGLLKIFGVRLPKTVKHGSFDSVVRPMSEIDDVLAHALVPLLDARVVLYQHYLELDRRIKRAASQDDVCMKLMTISGVGPIAANALLMRTMASSQIKSWGKRLIRTKGRRRAVVAVARKLAVLLHPMWVDGTEFRQEPVGRKA
jgi:transposase